MALFWIATVEYSRHSRCLRVAFTVLTTRPRPLPGMWSAATTRRLRRWKYACQSMASSLSLHAMCQIAAPGNVTVGYPASFARKPYSQSSHLMNSGSGCLSSSATWRGIMHIHQPLKSTSMRTVQQFRISQRILGEVVVVFDVRRGRPHEDPAVDHFTHHVKVATFLKVEHLPTTPASATSRSARKQAHEGSSRVRSRCRRP